MEKQPVKHDRFSGRVTVLITVVCLCALVLGGRAIVKACTEEATYEKQHPEVWTEGTVVDMRATFNIEPAQPGSVRQEDPLGGAIIGGAIAGNTGAVVGAIAGSQPKITPEKPAAGKLVACSIIVDIPSIGRKVFRYTDGGDADQQDRLKKCTTLRTGDQVSILQQHWGNLIWMP